MPLTGTREMHLVLGELFLVWQGRGRGPLAFDRQQRFGYGVTPPTNVSFPCWIVRLMSFPA
jgi:hypothetical protein